MEGLLNAVIQSRPEDWHPIDVDEEEYGIEMAQTRPRSDILKLWEFLWPVFQPRLTYITFIGTKAVFHRVRSL